MENKLKIIKEDLRRYIKESEELQSSLIDATKEWIKQTDLSTLSIIDYLPPELDKFKTQHNLRSPEVLNSLRLILLDTEGIVVRIEKWEEGEYCYVVFGTDLLWQRLETAIMPKTTELEALYEGVLVGLIFNNTIEEYRLGKKDLLTKNNNADEN